MPDTCVQDYRHQQRGLDAKLNSPLQSAEKLFLLTSPFIEPSPQGRGKKSTRWAGSSPVTRRLSLATALLKQRWLCGRIAVSFTLDQASGRHLVAFFEIDKAHALRGASALANGAGIEARD